MDERRWTDWNEQHQIVFIVTVGLEGKGFYSVRMPVFGRTFEEDSVRIFEEVKRRAAFVAQSENDGVAVLSTEVELEDPRDSALRIPVTDAMVVRTKVTFPQNRT